MLVEESFENIWDTLCTACFIVFIFATFSGARMPAPWHAAHSTIPLPWQVMQCAVFLFPFNNEAACGMNLDDSR